MVVHCLGLSLGRDGEEEEEDDDDDEDDWVKVTRDCGEGPF